MTRQSAVSVSPDADREPVSGALLRLDDDWRVVEANDPAAALLGRSPSEVTGRVVWDVVPAVRETDLPGALRAAAEDGRPRSVEVVHPERGTRLEASAYPTGEGLTVTVDERDDRDRLVALVDRPAFAVDDDARIADCNTALASALDRDRDAVLGERAVESVDGVAGPLRRAVEASATDAGLPDPEDDAVETTEVTVRPDTPARRRYEARVAPAPTGAVCVLRDRTTPRGRRQRLAVLDRVLRHNLRTEMNVVRGRLRTVADALDDPEMLDALAAVEESVDDLLSISDDVRRFADALDPEIGEARPYGAVEAVQATMTDVRSRHPEADLRLVVEDDVEMYAHESTLVAVEELLENAVVHTDDDRVRVTVSATGGRARIEVADHGDGIPDPERRVLTAGDETPLDHASGIGLWMVNWAVRKSGGRLTFDDPPERGSVVAIELPRPGDD